MKSADYTLLSCESDRKKCSKVEVFEKERNCKYYMMKTSKSNACNSNYHGFFKYANG